MYGSWAYWWAIDNVVVFEPDAFPLPAVLVSPADAGIDISLGATLNWAAGGGTAPTGYYINFGTDNPPTNIENGTDLGLVTNYTPSSLSYSTTYYWEIIPYNGAGSATGTTVWSFTTLADPTISTFPYTENFEGTFPPLNWSRYGGLLADPVVLVTSSEWFQDDYLNVTLTEKSARTNIYGTTRDGWLMTPPIDLGTGTNYQLEFNLGLTAFASSGPPSLTGTDDKFAVVISTDGGTTWTSTNTLRLWDNAGSAYVYNDIANAGQRIILDLTGYTGIVKFGFYGESTVSNADNDLFVDNIEIKEVPLVPIFSITPTSKDFGEVLVGQSSLDQTFTISNTGAGTLTITTGNISIVGTDASQFVLTDGNSYPIALTTGQSATVQVKFSPTTSGAKTADLQVVDNITEATNTVPLTGTGYSAVSTFTENFDAVTTPAFPLHWAKVGTGGSSNTQTTNPNSVPNCLYIYSGSISSLAVVSMPPVDNAGANTHRLTFKARANFTVGGIIEVGYLTDPNNAATFVSTGSVTVSSLTYQDYFVYPGTAPGANQFLAFRHTGSPANSVLIDDVSWEQIPAVADPTAFTATSINSSQIDLAFIPDASSHDVVIVWNSTGTFTTPVGTPVVGDPLADGTVLSIGTTTPVSHTGLTFATAYYYKAFSYDGAIYSSPGATANATTAVVNPTSVTANPISGTQIDLGWVKNSNNDNVMVVTNSTSVFGVPVNGTAYAVNDPVTGGGTVVYNGSASAFNHTLLTSGTTYYYKVYSAEVATNYYSSGVATNATTPFGIPYLQDFNAGTTIPAGWLTTFAISATHGAGGTNGLYKNLWSSAPTAAARTPFVGPAASNTTLQFDYRIVDYTGYPSTGTVYGAGNYIQVQISTDNTTWTTIYTIDDVTHVTSNLFATKVFNLGAYSGSLVYARFNCQWASGDYYVDFDNVYIGSPLVANPGSFTASAISTSQIDLAFTPNATPDNVVIVWNNTGTFTLPSGTPPAVGQPFAGGTLLSNGTTSPVNHTGLNASTAYYYKAFSFSGTEYSTGLTASATTVCGVFALPFAESFDAALFPPTCWTSINNGTGNNWLRSTSAPFAGAGNMRYTYNSLNAADAWMITPEFTLESGKKYYVSFYQNTSGAYPEKLKVTVGTAPDVVSQTTVIWDNDGGTELINATYELRVAEFVAPSTGSYYFGFNCYSDADQWYLNVDEISIIEQPTVDLAFTSFTQTSGLPVPRGNQNFGDYTVTMNKQTLVDGQQQFAQLNKMSVGVSSSDVNNSVIIPNGTAQQTDALANIDLQAEITNFGVNAASYLLDWDVSGSSQTQFTGPTVNSGNSDIANLTYTPTAEGTFITSGAITVTGDEVASNNSNQFRMRVYPDSYSRTIYDRGDNLVDTYVGWGDALIQFKAGVRFTAASDYQLGGVDFICRTEAVTSGEIMIQVRAAGTTTTAPGAVLYTKTYSAEAYLAAGEAGDYIFFPFDASAPTIASGSDYWITIKMPIGILYPGAVHNTGFTAGRSFFESNTDTTLWNALVITTERAWIMRSVNLSSATTTFQLTVNAMDGWNMVSVPGINPDGQGVDFWWSGRNPLASVYKWTGTYTAITSATPTEGYWMLHTGANTYNTGDEWPAGGIEIVAHDPIPITTGWNMIGGYENSPLVSGLTTTPAGLIVAGTVYGWNGAYFNPTNLEPGYGYWLLSTGDGVINPPTLANGPSKLVAQDNKEDWGKITLTDAAGKSYVLYAVNGEVNLESYQLPPLPPTGTFDVRYSSGKKAEKFDKESQTIEMRGITYPVKVRAEKVGIRIQDETGKIVNERLKSGEELTISNSLVSKLKVMADVIPVEYALEQNYPNPFNPSTKIEFSLPEDVNNVTLTIYNALGQRVAELVNSKMEAGQYSYQWNASSVATGMYIYELRTDKFVSVKKMMLLK